MSTALAELPIPLPPGAVGPIDCPPPVVCDWCEGTGEEPAWEFNALACFRCDGCGVLPADLDLGPTRAYGERRATYRPVCGVGRGLGELAIGTAVKPGRKVTRERYQLAEFDHDFEGRAFHLRKASDANRKHTVYVGPDGVSCTCEGETYQTSAKANQRAHEQGEETFPTYGCKHADSVTTLLLGGWFDL